MPDAERFLAEVSGDFQLRARVSVDFHATFDAGALLGWIDDRNWFKVCAELDPEGVPRVVSVVSRAGASDDTNSWPIDGLAVHLRISRRGRAFALHSSTDGTAWMLVRHLGMGLDAGDPVSVGLLAQSPLGDGTSATFTETAFSPDRLADIRDGS